MKYKDTRSLFLKKYRYKIALVCPVAGLLRGGNTDHALEQLSGFKLGTARNWWWESRIKTEEDYTYCISLCSEIAKLKDFDIRIEQPTVNIYTNNDKDVKLLERKYKDNIKYICKPNNAVVLEEGTIIMPKIDFDFKITLGSTKHENFAFIEWAEKNDKVKLTKSCIRDLSRNRSWGGTHLYVTGEKTLLLVKMHLGSSISKIQRIIKQVKE